MRRHHLLLLSLTALAIVVASCSNKHFISDETYREQTHEDFLKRKDVAMNRETELFSIMDNCSLKEREALEFLYAYMPYSDLADYSGDFFLDQVKYAFKTRETFSWNVPEDIFRHFVLVYRVNNENLDTARVAIYNELKDRVKDMSMYDAALEVNHLCHEKVTYRPSDARTSAPLATIKTAYGRCGEESTFTVTAMRAVGIPARQCYTPRWAHTDDNHAWVEVWVDGKWYYLGACEPDAELNMGWFSIPATRTMMVHSNAYGKYKGEEEVNYKTDLFSRINMLPNYTDTKKITIKVVDVDGNPVEDASVKFKLYNYAEYYPIATGTTDENGFASLTTGLGDLLIWASKDGLYNYAKMDVRTADSLTLSLEKTEGREYVELFEIVPPSALPTSNTVDAAEVERNNERLQYEDSLRNAYTATFPNVDTLTLQTETLSNENIRSYVKKSEGNYVEILTFIKDNASAKEGLLLTDYMDALSEKDFRDISAETLQQQLSIFVTDKYPQGVFVKGILPARISNEMIRPWRQYLRDNFSPLFSEDVTSDDIITWIKANIPVDKDGNYFNCPVSPQGVFELRHSDPHSRDIFLVAACRSLDIPAYLDGATNTIFVYENGSWNIKAFETEKQAPPTGELVLEYDVTPDFKPTYWIHYTIAKFENGDFVTFDFENDPRVESFPVKLELEAGYYMLSTGIRYSDGTTLSRLEFFNLGEEEVVVKKIVLRELTPRDEFYGNIDAALLPEYAKDKEIVLCFIDPTREPTKHLLKDICAFNSQFERWNGMFVFAIPSDKSSAGFKPSEWNLPKNSTFIIDENAEMMNEILSSTKQYFRDNYPLVFIVNPNGDLVFKTEGYRIGTGELIYKSL
ncbi:MAG: transglutaminase domain-containing protein [Bacteroidales bacterium]|nr:transglutaminase domain-containing protein [Bacteroidales bacterium]